MKRKERQWYLKQIYNRLKKKLKQKNSLEEPTVSHANEHIQSECVNSKQYISPQHVSINTQKSDIFMCLSRQKENIWMKRYPLLYINILRIVSNCLEQSRIWPYISLFRKITEIWCLWQYSQWIFMSTVLFCNCLVPVWS